MSSKNKFIKFDYIPLGQLAVGQSNVRTENVNDMDALTDLAEHIERHGLLEPIVVFDIKSLDSEHPLYSTRKDVPEQYEILAGQRRFTAFKKVLNVNYPDEGWDKIPCHIREAPDNETDAKAISLGEGLTQLPFTLADSINACDDLFKVYNDEKIVHKKTGISTNLIKRYVKFNRLPALVQDNLPMIHKNNKTAVNLAVAAADALRWSKAGPVSEEKVLELAERYGVKKAKSQADYKKIIRAAQENPDKTVIEIEKISVELEEPVVVKVVLEAPTYSHLDSYAKDQGKDPEDQAAELVEEGLARNQNIDELD
jgi:ParB/RepB/Spo0J family partition protein